MLLSSRRKVSVCSRWPTSDVSIKYSNVVVMLQMSVMQNTVQQCQYQVFFYNSEKVSISCSWLLHTQSVVLKVSVCCRWLSSGGHIPIHCGKHQQTKRDGAESTMHGQKSAMVSENCFLLLLCSYPSQHFLCTRLQAYRYIYTHAHTYTHTHTLRKKCI